MQQHDSNGTHFDSIVVDCNACAVGKSHQLTPPKKAQHAETFRPFQLCYGDLMGPFTPEAYGGFRHISKIPDYFIKSTTAYLFANKSLAFEKFGLFITFVVIHCRGRVICWHTDKREKQTDETFKKHYVDTGITREFIEINMPQQIGVSECIGQTLCIMIHCPLVGSGLPPEMWGEFMLTATYLCNRMSHSGIGMKTPFKRLYGKEENSSRLNTIGARAFVHVKGDKKLEPKSWEVVLCGSSKNEVLSYQIWNLKTRKVSESRNVTFIETPP